VLGLSTLFIGKQNAHPCPPLIVIKLIIFICVPVETLPRKSFAVGAAYILLVILVRESWTKITILLVNDEGVIVPNKPMSWGVGWLVVNGALVLENTTCFTIPPIERG